MTASAADSMLSQLRTRGFACVSLRPWVLEALRTATSRDAASMGEFRFPPSSEGRPIVYTDSGRSAFRALFEVATNCLGGMLLHTPSDDDDGVIGGSSGGGRGGGNGMDSARRMFAEALLDVRGDASGTAGSEFCLFRQENEPFRAGQPFSQSFFNLFNYDHGSLNSHVDRSLLTVIYSATDAQKGIASSSPSSPDDPPTPSEGNPLRSALWVKDRRGTWRDADRAVRPDQAIVMVGEDLERAGHDGTGCGIASALGLFAAEHAVRVDPTGARIERSHFRRDPGCDDGVVNRTSAAIILRHDPEMVA
eukprot:CAMPEP_0181098032 /NCGR_PEP_ID=MMETSP1071-20121207/11897_1 /TAXON_ID=35127 /ORGANISM="Thalassiosira sp., Strain NH16" /LENGTH=306 /DNA_ID=CAMNT_0023180575 /DNA_START=763 /DNA_END=1686 /DNA_ORIENTATION=-